MLRVNITRVIIWLVESQCFFSWKKNLFTGEIELRLKKVNKFDMHAQFIYYLNNVIKFWYEILMFHKYRKQAVNVE